MPTRQVQWKIEPKNPLIFPKKPFLAFVSAGGSTTTVGKGSGVFALSGNFAASAVGAAGTLVCALAAAFCWRALAISSPLKTSEDSTAGFGVPFAVAGPGSGVFPGSVLVLADLEFCSCSFSAAWSSDMTFDESTEACIAGTGAAGHPHATAGVSTESRRPSRKSACCSGLTS